MSLIREGNVGHPRNKREIAVIPLFAKNATHSSVPLKGHAAVAHSGGQGRPQAGARALPLTAASTMASARRLAGGGVFFMEHTLWTFLRS